MSYEYYEEAFLENKFFEYKADFAAKGYAEDDAEDILDPSPRAGKHRVKVKREDTPVESEDGGGMDDAGWTPAYNDLQSERRKLEKMLKKAEEKDI